MTPTLRNKIESEIRTLLFHVVIVVALTVMLLVTNAWWLGLAFGLINFLIISKMIGLQAHVIASFASLETSLTLQYMQEGYDAIRLDVVKLDEQAESHKSYTRRKSAMRFAKFTREVGEDLHKQFSVIIDKSKQEAQGESKAN